MTNSQRNSYSFRRMARRAIELIASRLPSRVGSSASLVLAYHNIVPAADVGHGDVSLHLSVDDFRRQLRLAGEAGDLVSIPTLLREHGTPGRRIAVTFDDAYRGCLRLGLPACADAGVTPAIFVAAELAGGVPIWDRLSARGEWAPTRRQQFLTEEQGLDDWRAHEAVPLPPDYAIATLEEVKAACISHSVHIGNHTLSHANLGALAESGVLSQVERGAAHVAAFGASAIDMLAYPYGLPPNAGTRSRLTPWCSAAFMVSGGWMMEADKRDLFTLPRMNVPAGISTAGFRARLRGYFRQSHAL